MRRKIIYYYKLRYLNDVLEINLFFLWSESNIAAYEFVWTLRSLVWFVFNNFLLIDATNKSKISSDQHRTFFVVRLYQLSFFGSTLFNLKIIENVYTRTDKNIQKTIKIVQPFLHGSNGPEQIYLIPTSITPNELKFVNVYSPWRFSFLVFYPLHPSYLNLKIICKLY